MKEYIDREAVLRLETIMPDEDGFDCSVVLSSDIRRIHAADVVERKRGEWVTPFKNDPFALVWKAFKNLYPDKECEIWWDQHQGDTHDEEYGFTQFPIDGSAPQVFLFAEHGVNIQVETLAHELAHVAVGIEHEHGEVWEAAFDTIFCEYNRIGDELFGGADMRSHQNILCDQTEEVDHA